VTRAVAPAGCVRRADREDAVFVSAREAGIADDISAEDHGEIAGFRPSPTEPPNYSGNPNIRTPSITLSANADALAKATLHLP
jgi:hypothetical protein